MEGFKINIPNEYEWDVIGNEPLQQLIDDALVPHRQLFEQQMVNEHTRFWNNVHDRLDDAKEQCAEYGRRIDALCSLNIGDEVTPEIRNIEKTRRPLLTLLRSPAALYDRLDTYIADMQSKFQEDLDRNIAALGMRCINEDYDLDTLRVSCIAAKANGLVLDFDAGQGKGFEALLSYSKGSSLLRSPHMRCIFSERSLKRKQGTSQTISPENGGNGLADRLVRVLRNVSDEMCDIYLKAQATYYGTLWEKLPYARQRYNELQKEIAMAGELGKSKEAKRLRKVANSFGGLVNSEAAKHLTMDSYLHHMKSEWEAYLERTANVLATKCMDKGMEDKETKISEIKLNGNSLEIRLKDGVSEIQTKCMIHGDKGVQQAPQLRTSVGDAVKLENQRKVQDGKNLPSLQEEKTELDKSAIPDGLITKAKIVEYADKLFITCYIAGERQSPQRIKPEEWKSYMSQPGNDKTGLVIAHFADRIQQALTGENQDLSRSGGRVKYL